MNLTPKFFVIAALVVTGAACGGSSSAGSKSPGSTAPDSASPVSGDPTTTPTTATTVRASTFDLTFSGEQNFHVAGAPHQCLIITTSTPHQFSFDIGTPQFPKVGQGFEIIKGLSSGTKWISADNKQYGSDGTAGMKFSADLHDLKIDTKLVGASGPNAVRVVGTVHCA